MECALCFQYLLEADREKKNDSSVTLEHAHFPERVVAVCHVNLSFQFLCTWTQLRGKLLGTHGRDGFDPLT